MKIQKVIFKKPSQLHETISDFFLWKASTIKFNIRNKKIYKTNPTHIRNKQCEIFKFKRFFLKTFTNTWSREWEFFNRNLNNWIQFMIQKFYETSSTHIQSKQCENLKVKKFFFKTLTHLSTYKLFLKRDIKPKDLTT